MTIDVDGNAYAMVSELIPHISQGFPRLNEQARIGVPDIMHPNLPEFRFFNGFVKDSFPPVIYIQRGTSIAYENPLRDFSPSFINGFDLPLMFGVFQNLGQLL